MQNKRLTIKKFKIQGIDFRPYSIEIRWKKIKHIYFRLYPSKQSIVISAPFHVSEPDLAAAIHSKTPWIKKQIKKERQKKNRPALSIIDGGKIRLWGRALRIETSYEKGRAKVCCADENRVQIRIALGDSIDVQQRIISAWLRKQLQAAINDLVIKWEPVIKVRVNEARIRKMKTRWGSCNIVKKRLWLNSVLVHLPTVFLEYVVVHEMVHLLERNHNNRFKTLMDQFIPDWRVLKSQLNSFNL